MMLGKNVNLESSKLTAHQLGLAGSWLVTFILAFTSLRGWAVLNLNISPELVYGFSSLLLIVMAVFGFNYRARIKDANLSSLKNLLLINGLFGFLYVIVAKLLGGAIDVSIFYLYLVPYVIYLFFRVSKNKIILGLNIIFLGITYSVINNFIISLSGVEGYDYLVEYNTKLRPLVFKAMSRTGEYLRASGYTASYHDSANILGMLTNFFYFRAVITISKGKMIYLGMALVAFIAMLFTQSAANILIALFTILVFSIYYLIKKKSLYTGIFILFTISIAYIISLLIPEVYIFIDRVSPDGDWVGMKKNIDIDILINPHFWFGHVYLGASEEYEVEVAFIKGIMQLGIIPACYLYLVLIYPLYVYVTNKTCSFTLLPYLAAIVFGFLSLAHYGSLFRITSIVVFYAMYALFFITMNDEKYKFLRRNGS
jgi:hypothetical protein